METFDEIRKISFIFFIAVGLIHFFAGFSFINGYALPLSGVVNRVSFIPFVIVSLSYALSNAKYNLLQYGKTSKAWDYAFLGFSIAVFLILIGIEFFIADSPIQLRNL